MTVYTAIFNNYDSLKEPLIITPGVKYVCYTNTDLQSKAWEVKKIETDNPQLTARRIKILFNLYTETKNSMWIDGSFQINCDIIKWWNNNFRSAMTCIKHPVRDCIYEEAKACIDMKRKGIELIGQQIEDYKKTIPEHSGLIQSGILMRTRTDFTIRLCKAWWNEVKKYSNRDQIAFGKVSYQQPIKYMTWDYRKGREFLYKGHLKNIPTY